MKKKENLAKWNISRARGKENNKDSVSSGERKRKKPQSIIWKNEKNKSNWTYKKVKIIWKSKTEYVKVCLKKGGPPSKLKYNLIDR